MFLNVNYTDRKFPEKCYYITIIFGIRYLRNKRYQDKDKLIFVKIN